MTVSDTVERVARAEIAETINGLVRILTAVRYTAGLGKGQWERVEKAKALAAMLSASRPEGEQGCWG